MLFVAELGFACNVNYLARAFGNNTYNYEFRVHPGVHGSDFPYAFYNGPDEVEGGIHVGNFGPVIVDVARTLQGYIVNFVKYQSLFAYAPSMAAAAFFTSAFGLSAVLHLGQAMYFKTWCVIPLVVGALFETVGYIMRCLSAREDFACWSLPPFIIHSILVLVAPAVIAASVYMLLEKIIRLSNSDSYSILSPR